MNNLLEVKDLCKHYHTFSLKEVSFTLPEGYIMGFIGANGAGKTTTLKAILEMIQIDSGQIKLFDDRYREHPEQAKEELGVVMDLPFFVDDWSVNEVEDAITPFYSRWDKNKFRELLSFFKISANKKIKEFSRGMKVKIMLAVALSHDAKLLILDEPSSGLDPVARDELMDLLKDFVLDEKRGVIFSTHITSDLEKIADYITYIQGGKIAYSGLKDDLMERYQIIKGGLSDLSEDLEKELIGCRKFSTGFEGMILSDTARSLPPDFLLEPLTLDQYMIFMNKEAD